MSKKISAPRGTKDVLPTQSHAWQTLERTLHEVARRFDYREIRFPTFEHTELFLRGVGDTTDVVQKEMYTFPSKSGRSLTLRPEGTASAVRLFIQNALYAAGLPQKLYYIAPNFRYENPQAGRYREHHQFGVECFGSPHPEADAEVIALADSFLRALHLTDVRLSINSIGCKACRPAYLAALQDYYTARRDELCPTCHDRLTRNPLRLLDCKETKCARLSEDAPAITDHLCPDCAAHMDALCTLLTEMRIDYTVNPRIVRGLDYYTRTVFEFVTDQLGAQSTVCGGGRYDELVETLGGPSTPGLGFGAGLERLLLVMEAQGQTPAPPTADLCVVTAGQVTGAQVAPLVLSLRRVGLGVAFDLMRRSLGAQMKAADKQGARWCLVLGESEMNTGKAQLKRMSDGEKRDCALTAEDIARVLGE